MSSCLTPPEMAALAAFASQGFEVKERDGWSRVGMGVEGGGMRLIVRFNLHHPIIKAHHVPFYFSNGAPHTIFIRCTIEQAKFETLKF